MGLQARHLSKAIDFNLFIKIFNVIILNISFYFLLRHLFDELLNLIINFLFQVILFFHFDYKSYFCNFLIKVYSFHFLFHLIIYSYHHLNFLNC